MSNANRELINAIPSVNFVSEMTLNPNIGDIRHNSKTKQIEIFHDLGWIVIESNESSPEIKIIGKCKYCKSSIFSNQKACESCGAPI